MHYNNYEHNNYTTISRFPKVFENENLNERFESKSWVSAPEHVICGKKWHAEQKAKEDYAIAERALFEKLKLQRFDKESSSNNDRKSDYKSEYDESEEEPLESLPQPPPPPTPDWPSLGQPQSTPPPTPPTSQSPGH